MNTIADLLSSKEFNLKLVFNPLKHKDTKVLQEQQITDFFSNSKNKQNSSFSGFIAELGASNNGLNFIEEATENKAKFCITSFNAWRLLQEQNTQFNLAVNSFSIPIYILQDFKENLFKLLLVIYGNNIASLDLIGVTGTNGKTSTAHFTAQLLEKICKQKIGVLGTLGNGVYGKLKRSNLTTIDLVSLYNQLNQLAQQGITKVIMEISSHAIVQGRIKGLSFFALGFTNFSQDHLDYHKTLENYWAAKKQLFTDYKFKHGFFNLDDVRVASLYKELKDKYKTRVFGYTIQQNQQQIIRIVKNKFQLSGWQLCLVYGLQQIKVTSKLLGDFNISNLLLSMNFGLLYTLNFPRLASVVHAIKPVPGRMEVVATGVMVDFAHTPNAFESLLTSIKASDEEIKIILVFGCGGNRDRSKRALMGKVAARLADIIIVTSDNPRDEKPKAIIDDIVLGIKSVSAISTRANSYYIKLERVKAIEFALKLRSKLQYGLLSSSKQQFVDLQQANEQKYLVVIAGKGAEDYQEVRGIKYPYSDKNVVQEIIASNNKLNNEQKIKNK